MKSLIAAALVICFAVQCGKALAHASNNNCYVNSSGHVLHSPSCGQEHEKRTAECRDGALAFRSITAGPARTTAAWRTGIDPASYGWRSFVAARLSEACATARRSVRAQSPLRYIWIQSYAFGSANLHDQCLKSLT
jgi:hypothetical protein